MIYISDEAFDMSIEDALVQLKLGPGLNEDVSEEYNEATNIAIKILETFVLSSGEETESEEGVKAYLKTAYITIEEVDNANSN